MKKLIFTAFAVVMFSSISTAKTAEVVNRKVVLGESSCCSLYNLAYNLAISEGHSSSYASGYATAVENNCLAHEMQRLEEYPNDFVEELIIMEP